MADPHNHTHQRRHTRLGVLAALTLTAALLTVATAPAHAAEIKTGDANEAEAEATADYTVCVGEARSDAGFEDLQGLGDDTTDAINCLAYYGITKGRNGGTEFDPDSNVTRGQMALFLYRAAKAAGIDLMGGDMDAMYGDIDELSEERQAAIKALGRNGILTGRNSMSFYPLADITRSEMAIALVNLTRHTAPSKFDVSGDLDGVTLDHFADARYLEPRSVDKAISEAYELGITTGYPNGTSSSTEFRPKNPVPRRNMATFIIRALDHSNLRPAGVTVQRLRAGDIRVSVRDRHFQPEPNVSVDMFKASTARTSDVFDDDGACTRLPVAVNGTSKCKIDINDPSTDHLGNLLTPGAQPPSGGDTLWVWTGADDSTVDSTTELFQLDIPEGEAPAVADTVKVTTNLPEGAAHDDCDGNSTDDDPCEYVRYGSSVTYTIQLQDDDHDDNPLTPPVNAGPPKGGAKYQVTISYPNGRISVDTKNVDAAGTATFTVNPVVDPNTKALDSDSDPEVMTKVEVTVTPVANSRGAFLPDGDTPTALADVPQIRFTDASPKVTTVKVATSSTYRIKPARDTRQNATVTVLDQYGKGMEGVLVALGVEDGTEPPSAPLENPITRTTITNGEASPNYVYSASSGVNTQQIKAFADGDRTTAGFQATDAAESDAVTVHWVSEPTTISSPSGMVMEGDLSARTLILDVGGTPTLVVFDSNDQFTATQGDATTYGMEAFVKAVAQDANLTPSPADTTDVTVTANGYNPDDSAAVTNWVAAVN